MNPNIKTIIAIMVMSLVLFGSGCTGEDKKTPQYTNPSATLGEEEIAEFESINSSVNLSLGEMLTTTGTVWRNSITIVEISATNTGEENVSVAYAVALFNNGKDPIVRSWDDGNRILEPGEMEAFYFRVDPIEEDLFETNDSVNFEFALTSATGNNQTIVYKGKALIPWANKGESSDLNITRMTE